MAGLENPAYFSRGSVSISATPASVVIVVVGKYVPSGDKHDDDEHDRLLEVIELLFHVVVP